MLYKYRLYPIIVDSAVQVVQATTRRYVVSVW